MIGVCSMVTFRLRVLSQILVNYPKCSAFPSFRSPGTTGYLGSPMKTVAGILSFAFTLVVSTAVVATRPAWPSP